MIKGAIIDIDGTILDSMPAWDNAGELYLYSLGIVAEPKLHKIMFSMSMVEGAEYLKKKYYLGMEIDEIVDGINLIIKDFYDYHVQLKEGAKSLLEQMQEANIKMVVATSSDRVVLEKALSRLKVKSYFKKIFTCSEVGSGKEKPDIYLAAAEYLGITPEETLVIEDALYAIKTAKNAGFKIIGVFDQSSVDKKDEIRQTSHIFLESLEDLGELNSLLKEFA